MLHKVISGGQTGSDQAGLIAAARFGIATGGWMPRGFETADGPNPRLAERFGLREHTGGYVERTSTNVRDSDGTIRIANLNTGFKVISSPLAGPTQTQAIQPVAKANWMSIITRSRVERLSVLKVIRAAAA